MTMKWGHRKVESASKYTHVSNVRATRQSAIEDTKTKGCEG